MSLDRQSAKGSGAISRPRNLVVVLDDGALRLRCTTVHRVFVRSSVAGETAAILLNRR
jgi:hypothetical protein